VRVTTTRASRTRHGPTNRVVKISRDGYGFTGAAQEPRHQLPAQFFVFPPKLKFQRSLATQKDDGVFKDRSALSCNSSEHMSGNQQIISPQHADYLHSHETRGNNPRMDAIHRQTVQALQPGQPVAVFAGKAAVRSEFSYRTSGLLSAKDIPIRQSLVFNGHCGDTTYSRLLKVLEGNCRQTQASQCQQFTSIQGCAILGCHTWVSMRGRIGQPKAARISSLLHPAQQRYLRGSAMLIAKLSEFLSRTPQAGQRVR